MKSVNTSLTSAVSAQRQLAGARVADDLGAEMDLRGASQPLCRHPRAVARVGHSLRRICGEHAEEQIVIGHRKQRNEPHRCARRGNLGRRVVQRCDRRFD